MRSLNQVVAFPITMLSLFQAKDFLDERIFAGCDVFDRIRLLQWFAFHRSQKQNRSRWSSRLLFFVPSVASAVLFVEEGGDDEVLFDDIGEGVALVVFGFRGIGLL